jgi:hypothetical protein
MGGLFHPHRLTARWYFWPQIPGGAEIASSRLKLEIFPYTLLSQRRWPHPRGYLPLYKAPSINHSRQN